MTSNTGGRFKFLMKVLTIILVLALLIGYAIYARVSNRGSNRFQTNILIPWGLMAVFISFYLFREFNRVKQTKRNGAKRISE